MRAALIPKANLLPAHSKRVGQHRSRFSKRLWDKWLDRMNETPDMHLREGIQEFRSLLANPVKRRFR